MKKISKEEALDRVNVLYSLIPKELRHKYSDYTLEIKHFINAPTPTAELNKQVISADEIVKELQKTRTFETTLELAHKITTFFMNESDTK